MARNKNQTWLFEDMKPTLAEDKEIRTNVYYMAISAFQKCVRRSMTEEAVRFAKVAWNLEPYRLYARFHTVLVEDCAWDLELLRKFHYTKFTTNDWSDMEHLIREMCKSKRADNSTTCLSLMITGNDPPKESVIKYLVDNDMDDILTLRNDWILYRYGWYDEGRIPEDMMWLVDACERSTKFDREKLAVCIPALVNHYGIDAINNAPVINECPDTHMIDEWLPAPAMDGHTRPGLMAIRVLFSRLERPLPAIHDKGLVFYYEGGLRNDKTDLFTGFKDAYFEDYQNVIFKSSQVESFYNKYVKNDLNEVREWVVHSKMKDEFEVFKQMYDSAFEE